MTDKVVVVDDMDANIKYTGDWTVDHGSQDSFSIFGPEYDHTLHGTTTNGTSASYDFHGLSIPSLNVIFN
jgi:hypothetical protein